MPYLTWSDELTVGVKKFDEEHQELVSFINQLHAGILAGDASSKIYSVLEGLIDYTEIHFSHEEDLMILKNYPDFEAHKKEHEILVKSVLEFKKKLDEGKEIFSLELMSFLKDWLVKHINITDKKYSEFFIENGVS